MGAYPYLCQTAHPGSPQGFLFKRGVTNTDWKRRWFVYDMGVLSYYKSDVEKEPSGQIPIESMLSVAPSASDSRRDPPYTHCFDVTTAGGRAYALCAESARDLATWTGLLLRNMAALPPDARAVTVAACTKVGFLFKRGEVNPAFRRRLFGLHGRDLYYFKSEEDPVPLGSIDLRTIVDIREGLAPVRPRLRGQGWRPRVVCDSPARRALLPCTYTYAIAGERAARAAAPRAPHRRPRAGPARGRAGASLLPGAKSLCAG